MPEPYAVTVPSVYRVGAWEVREPIATGAFGSVYEARHVGDNWNDKIRSARTEDRNVKVELWEHVDCTGWSITIDDTGYGNIGPWVTSYRVTT